MISTMNDIAKRIRENPRSRASSRDHYVQRGSTAGSTRAECLAIELALADGNEEQRRIVSANHAIVGLELERHQSRPQADPRRGNHTRQTIAEMALAFFTISHEVDVSADRA